MGIRRGLNGVLRHGDRIAHLFEREGDRQPVFARANPCVLDDTGLKPLKLGLNAVPAWRQTVKGDRALIGRLDGLARFLLRRLLDAFNRDDRARQNRARLIVNDDNESAFARGGGGPVGLCRRTRRLRQRAAASQDRTRQDPRRGGASLFTTSNFFGSIFALIRNRSKVVSSTVSAPTARRKRNGNFIPSTSR